MKKQIYAILAILLFPAILSGCANPGTDSAYTSAETSENTDDTEATDFSLTDSDMFTERDYETEYDESNCVHIQLNQDSAEASSDSVRISGTTVTLTEEAVYIISGTLDDGMIIVDAPDTAKLQLILNNVNIYSETSAALYISEADKVFVTLADGTENTLSNGGTFTAVDDSNIDGAIFSRQDLTLNGSGALTVLSPAGHGIVCKDDLKITGGTYAVTSASHGLDANDSIRITGETTFTIDAGKDGMHAENDEDTSLGFVYISNGTMDIETEGDGISAGSYMQIRNGNFRILAGGGYENGTINTSVFPTGKESVNSVNTGNDSSTSMKGIKSSGDMSVSGGSFLIDSADDSFHSNTSIILTGGTFEIASGDDAFHADDMLTVTDGTILITESYEGMEALHVCIQGGEITLTASDDGLNAAGGVDASGTSGGRDGMFGGNRPDGDMPDGNEPDGSMPDGNEPDDDMPDGDMPGGNGPDGSMPDGDMPGGNGPDGSMPDGNGPDSSMPDGDMSGGNGSDGSMPDGNEPDGNTSGGDNTDGGMPGDNTFGGAPSSSSDGSIVISGGTLYITASGDGLDANGSIEISGGYIVVTCPVQGDTATLDYDTSAVITGGVFIGTGASDMAQTFSNSKQSVLSVNAGSQDAGTTITITDANGATLLEFSPELPFNVIIFSSPELISGETYTISAGSFSQKSEAQ